MQFACLLVGLLMIAIATSSAIRVSRARRWTSTKATILRCRRLDVFGQPSSTAWRRQVVVLLDDGTEEIHTRLWGPQALYLAELVYVVEGAPYSARVSLDQPENGTLDLWYDPANPREYAPELRSYWFAASMGLLGGIFVAAFFV